MNHPNVKLFRLLLAVLPAITYSSCSSDADSRPEPQPQTWRVSVATGADDGADDVTRTQLSVSGTTMSAAWQTSDVVQVYKGGSSVGTLSPATATASASLNGTLTGTFAVNNTLDLYWPSNSPDYSTQDGTLTGTNGISKKDFIEASVTVQSVDPSNGILRTTRADFTHRQSFTKFTFSTAVKTVKISATGMSDITVTASADQTVFYVAMPLEGSVEYTFLCTTNAGVEYRGTKTGDLTHGKYYLGSVDIAPGVGVTNTSSWGNNSTENVGNIYF